MYIFSEGQVLSSSNLDWVNDTWKQVISLLSDTPPDGKNFSAAVEHLMNREEAWNGWKNEGCPGINYIYKFFFTLLCIVI